MSFIKEIKKIESEQLAIISQALVDRLESIVDACIQQGVNLDAYTVFSEDKRGEVTVEKAPMPDYKKIADDVKSGKISPVMPVIIGAAAELSDMIVSMMHELDSR